MFTFTTLANIAVLISGLWSLVNLIRLVKSPKTNKNRNSMIGFSALVLIVSLFSLSYLLFKKEVELAKKNFELEKKDIEMAYLEQTGALQFEIREKDGLIEQLKWSKEQTKLDFENQKNTLFQQLREAKDSLSDSWRGKVKAVKADLNRSNQSDIDQLHNELTERYEQKIEQLELAYQDSITSLDSSITESLALSDSLQKMVELYEQEVDQLRRQEIDTQEELDKAQGKIKWLEEIAAKTKITPDGMKYFAMGLNAEMAGDEYRGKKKQSKRKRKKAVDQYNEALKYFEQARQHGMQDNYILIEAIDRVKMKRDGQDEDNIRDATVSR